MKKLTDEKFNWQKLPDLRYNYVRAYMYTYILEYLLFDLQANNQIQMFGGDAASVILILTDGFINDLSSALIQVCTMGYIKLHYTCSQ